MSKQQDSEQGSPSSARSHHCFNNVYVAVAGIGAGYGVAAAFGFGGSALLGLIILLLYLDDIHKRETKSKE